MATKLLEADSSPHPHLRNQNGGAEIPYEYSVPRALLPSLGYIAALELAKLTALLNLDKATNVNINQTSP